MYHSLLYRYHVLGDTSVPNPGLPPFYSKDFFLTIQTVANESNKNIFDMTEKEWYSLLLEENIKVEVVESGIKKFVQCRVERLSPETDWENS